MLILVLQSAKPGCRVRSDRKETLPAGAASHFPDGAFDAVASNYLPEHSRRQYLPAPLRTPKKGGTLAIHDIFFRSKYGGMQAFVKKPRDMGYRQAELIGATDGKFMKKSEAGWMALSGSPLLTGVK